MDTGIYVLTPSLEIVPGVRDVFREKGTQNIKTYQDLETSSSSKGHKSYSELRKEAQRAAEAKDAANRMKTKKQSTRHRVEEGLSTSLFERAVEEEALGLGPNKALGMMKKMGFKPGQSLGRKTVDELPRAIAESSREGRSGIGASADAKRNVDADDAVDPSREASSSSSSAATPGPSQKHRTEPLPISFWAGKKGLGLGPKRPASPGAIFDSLRLSKRPKVDHEKESAEAFRERTRLEYEEKRAEARLVAATRTCVSLDDRGGIKFNILWLNPHNPNTCPPELLAAFEALSNPDEIQINEALLFDPTAFNNETETETERTGGKLDLAIEREENADPDEPTLKRRSRPQLTTTSSSSADPRLVAALREQMQKDALRPIEIHGPDEEGGEEYGGKFGPRTIRDLRSEDGDSTDDYNKKTEVDSLEFSAEEVEDARTFLGLPAKDRLERVLKYLRVKYSYCFWCGTQYEDAEDMDASCPGEDEDAHD